MYDIVGQLLENTAWVLSQEGAEDLFRAWFSFAIGTVFLFLPVYGVLAIAGWAGWRGKTFSKVLTSTVGLNAALALFPFAVALSPFALVFYGARWQYRRMKAEERRQLREERRGRGRRNNRRDRRDNDDEGDLPWEE
jgi:hypothetical protein